MVIFKDISRNASSSRGHQILCYHKLPLKIFTQNFLGIPWWLSGLRNWHCFCDSGHCCGMGSLIPGCCRKRKKKISLDPNPGLLRVANQGQISGWGAGVRRKRPPKKRQKLKAVRSRPLLSYAGASVTWAPASGPRMAGDPASVL